MNLLCRLCMLDLHTTCIPYKPKNSRSSTQSLLASYVLYQLHKQLLYKLHFVVLIILIVWYRAPLLYYIYKEYSLSLFVPTTKEGRRGNVCSGGYLPITQTQGLTLQSSSQCVCSLHAPSHVLNLLQDTLSLLGGDTFHVHRPVAQAIWLGSYSRMHVDSLSKRNT